MTLTIVEHNIYCGQTEPQAVIETAYSKTVNEGIYSTVVTNADGEQQTIWFITQSTKYIYEDKIKEITDEHDELIAELIEGGNA